MHNGDTKFEVDHKDINLNNNLLENLREATRNDNVRNTKIHKNNKSGYKGVCWDKQRRKWHAQIGINNKRISLGFFDTPEEAKVVYDKATEELYGKFARSK